MNAPCQSERDIQPPGLWGTGARTIGGLWVTHRMTPGADATPLAGWLARPSLLRAAVLLTLDVYVPCANSPGAATFIFQQPSPTQRLFPERGKTPQPRVATLWSRPLGIVRRATRPGKGRTRFRIGARPVWNPFRVRLVGRLAPGCATKASRPWAAMCDPVGVEETRLFD